MNVVALIQARMGSTRLPGKTLADICGRSMLAWVCMRVGRATLVNRVVVATTDQPQDQAIVDECARRGVTCFRGSEPDVLDRFHRATVAFQAEAVVRVTADCPLVDPEVIDLVVRAFLSQQPDYAANTLWRTWPRGLDTEVIGAAALARAWREATEPYERVHVTPYIYRHPELFQLLAVAGPCAEGDTRWTVDMPEDLALVRAIYERLPDDDSFSWRDVRRLVSEEPALAELNRHVRQKDLAEG